MRTNKKYFVVGVAIAVALVGIIGYRVYANVAANKDRAARMAQGKTATVSVAKVTRRDITPVLSFSANLEPVWTADVSSKVDGRINTLTVDEGDVIKAGSVIASLDTGELAAQVNQAQGNLMAAQSNLEQAQLDYQRMASLADQGAISAQALDTARTKRDLAVGQVKAAQANVDLLAEHLNQANVTAPRDGVVTKRYVQAGAYTKTGAPIITLADVNSLLAKATVGEAQIAELSVGQTVKVSIDALGGQEFSGVITRISPVAALPARTFTAEVSIPNANGILKAGMFAKASIPGHPHKGVLAVPQNSLVMREDQQTVFVLAGDNTVQQRVIKVGYIGDGWAEVLEGLNEGDQIVVAGQNKIKDGATVEVSANPEGGN